MSDFEARARKAARAVKREIDEKHPGDLAGLKRAQRSHASAAIPSSVAVVLVAAAGLFFATNGSSSGSGSSDRGARSTPYQLAGALKPFGECDAALQYFKDQGPQYLIDEANNQGGRYYPTNAPNTGFEPPAPATGRDDAANPSVASGSINTDPTAHSTTNNQVAGVDEPDTIKTDGNTIVTVANNEVFVLAANGGHPKLEATLSDVQASQLFFSNNKLLVLSNVNSQQPQGGGFGFPPGIEPAGLPSVASSPGQKSTLFAYDLADPAHPQKLGSMVIDGGVVDARLVGSQVRLVTDTSTNPDFPSPSYGSDGKVDQKSIAALHSEVANSTISDWVPQYSSKDASGTVKSQGQLVSCADLAHPTKFSGLDTVAVVTFDINRAPVPTHAAGLVASGNNVYANVNDLYVSATDYGGINEAATAAANTNIHKFNVAADGSISYAGSGQVEGQLLNQYSMDEYNGDLRVATTVTGSRGWINRTSTAAGQVAVLQNRDGSLKQVGKVDGLGADNNESVTAVRFVGPLGYVSTARNTDPLFVIDLNDTTKPVVAGQLSIPGFSGDLEPLSNGLIMGVGQSDTGDGGGVQFSLFNVSNPAQPKRVGYLAYGMGNAAAQFDAHAFLYWQPRNLVIAPATIQGLDGINEFSGLLLMQPDGNKLTEIGRLADTEYMNHGNGYSPVSRTVVVGNEVYMLSADNLQVDSLDTHAQVGVIALS